MLVVTFDLACVVAFVVYLWLIPQYIKVDAERHRNLLFETQEFAIEFNNLPRISEEYPVFTLKIDLRDHIETQIK
jgi:hypothetical protein